MKRLGDLERSVMTALWDAGSTPLTGREVADQFPDRAYTTVLTVLERLRQKGLVARLVEGRVHRFSPVESREAYRAELMMDALGDATDRSAVLVRFAESVTPDEVALLRQALDTLETKRRGGPR
jgi:predicted transcriptional regulator